MDDGRRDLAPGMAAAVARREPVVPPEGVPDPGLRVGIDLVRVSRIEESLRRFGDRFTSRLFTAAEITYARAAPSLAAERFAARFAAKEAAVKALRLGGGFDWRHIEVVRDEDGACALALHGAVARRAGACALAVSLSHEGDFATAVVVAQFPSVPQ